MTDATSKGKFFVLTILFKQKTIPSANVQLVWFFLFSSVIVQINPERMALRIRDEHV